MNRESLKQSWRMLPHPIRWFVVASIGGTLILVGIIFLVFPGPGIPLIIAGFAILASEFTWAGVVLSRMKENGNNLINKTKSIMRARRDSNPKPSDP